MKRVLFFVLFSSLALAQEKPKDAPLKEATCEQALDAVTSELIGEQRRGDDLATAIKEAPSVRQAVIVSAGVALAVGVAVGIGVGFALKK